MRTIYQVYKNQFEWFSSCILSHVVKLTSIQFRYIFKLFGSEDLFGDFGYYFGFLVAEITAKVGPNWNPNFKGIEKKRKNLQSKWLTWPIDINYYLLN